MGKEQAQIEGHKSHRRIDVARMSRFLKRAEQVSPDIAKRIVEDELVRQHLRRVAGRELYGLWNKILQGIVGRMNKQFRQAIKDKQMAMDSAQKSPKDILIDDGKSKARKVILKINEDLIAEIIDQMLRDGDLNDAFRGKEALLRKFTAYLEAQAPFLTEKDIKD